MWNLNTSSSSIPQLTGPRIFSFEEIRKCTKNFLEENRIGSGAYGKVSQLPFSISCSHILELNMQFDIIKSKKQWIIFHLLTEDPRRNDIDKKNLDGMRVEGPT